MSDTVEIPTTHVLVATINFDVKEELQNGYWKFTVEMPVRPAEMVGKVGLAILAQFQETVRMTFESKGWGDKLVRWEVFPVG